MSQRISQPIPQLSFARHNLRCNPFGELSHEQWVEAADVDAEFHAHQLRKFPRSALQFIGDKGFGKTTHLLSIQKIFPTAHYVHIPEGERRSIPSENSSVEGVPILIDEAQRLTWDQRRQLFAGDRPLVLGTHRDFSRNLRRTGFVVTTVNVETLANAQRTQNILNARIAMFVRDPNLPVVVVSAETAQQVHGAHNGCLRAIVHDMYVRFQRFGLSTGTADVSL